ncbi:MAG: hypothetical protein AAGA35_01520 [Patescibacteria group bacterium]
MNSGGRELAAVCYYFGMIRTRDFLLFALAFVFLLIAISATVLVNDRRGSGEVVPTLATNQVELELTASVEESAVDRAATAARLRSKIAALGESVLENVSGTSVEESDVNEEIESEGESDEAEVTSLAIQYCDEVTEVVTQWPTTNIFTAEREGARVVFTTEVVQTPVLVRSTTELISETQEVVLLQLPMRQRPLPTTSCIGTDVIGVGLDGSMIRNNEQLIYSIFGPETLIGYALDGLPIYGATAELDVDECGGAMVGIGYRYFIHPDRDGILGCYSGVPVTI